MPKLFLSRSLGLDEPGTALGDSNPTLIFDSFIWQNGDAGSHVKLDLTGDPDFNHVVALLTNGSNDRMWVGAYFYPGPGGALGGGPESVFFFNDPDGLNSSDLHGFQLTRIEMLLNTFQIVVPGSDPNHDGLWTDLTANATFTFYGVAVPEANSFALTSVAVLAGMSKRRGKRRRPASYG